MKKKTRSGSDHSTGTNPLNLKKTITNGKNQTAKAKCEKLNGKIQTGEANRKRPTGKNTKGSYGSDGGGW